METKKIRIRPEGADDYGTVLHPETSADQVKITNNAVGEPIPTVEEALIFRSDAPPEGVVEGRLWLDTSDNTFQENVLNELPNRVNSVEQELNAHQADYATITSMEFPFSEGLIESNNARITKIGKVVNLNIGGKKSDGSVFTQGAQFVIGLLPVGYRPTHGIILPAGLGDNEWQIHDVGYVYIGVSGQVIVRNSVNSTAKVVYFNTSYIVD